MAELIEAVEIVEKPLRKRSKAVAGEVIEALGRLENYEPPVTETGQYLDNQAGRYVRMLEGVVDVAAQLGLYDLVRATLVDLVRLTKIGRAKADVNIFNKLRDEYDFSRIPAEELESIVSKSSGRGEPDPRP